LITTVNPPDSVDEEVIDGVTVAFRYPGILGGRTTGDDIALEFVGLEEVGHFARVEDVVNVLQKLLNDDLRHNT